MSDYKINDTVDITDVNCPVTFVILFKTQMAHMIFS